MPFSFIGYMVRHTHCKGKQEACQFQELSRPKIRRHREQQIPESSCRSKGKNKNSNQNIH